jgi:leader peptidase (prepilin peptidase) / N-methyltransferase
MADPDGKVSMSHLSVDVPAIALGAVIGAAAGLYARRAMSRTADHVKGDQIPARSIPGWLLAVIGGVAAALIGARFGLQARLPAYLYLAAIAPALGAVDAATRRLPNRILLPAYPVAAVLLGYAAWRDGDAAALWRGILAGALLFAVFLAVALAAPPGSLGFGDVKLVGLLGLFTGYLNWPTVWLAMMAAFGLAALYVVVRALIRRGERGQVLPLGPALLLGSLTAVIAS